jgi:hypothetical protein
MNRIKNAKKQSIGGVLFLQGVFKTDCDRIEDFFHDRLLHGNSKPKKLYDKLPIVFTGLDMWPTHTNLLCCNCTLSIQSRPWFEPQSINPVSTGPVGNYIKCSDINKSVITNKYNINTKGCFCSSNCVMRNILNFSKSMSDRIDKIFMLLFVYEIYTGVKIPSIEPAPQFTELVQFGGDKTESELRKQIDELNNTQLRKENELFISNCKTYLNTLME